MTMPTRCYIHELYLPKLCSVLHGRITRGFPEALDKVIGRVEGETFRDSPHRQIGGFQKELCPFYFGKAYIAAYRLPGLYFELFSQIVLCITHQSREICGPDPFIQTQFNIIAAFLDGVRVVGVGVQMMNTINEVMIHGVSQRAQFSGITAVFSRLNVGIPE